MAMRAAHQLVLPIVLLAAAGSWAAKPELKAVRPPGGQRGTEVEVVLSGERLGDAAEILYYQGGIETLALEKVDDKSVKARLRLAADCALGSHDLRLRTQTGVSELRTFSVGALPEVSEAEPNNDFAAPQAIGLGSVVNGVAEREDIDYFAVEAKKGQRLTAEVEGIRLGITQFDAYVAILDTKRFELASSDDLPLVRQDGVASILVPEDGTYIVAVRESAFAGNGGCLYRLHLGSFPRPTATLPAGGPAGETVEVKWIGDVKGDWTEPITLPASGAFGLYAKDDQGEAPYASAFRVTPLANVLETEPNGDHATATAFTPPAALNGLIEQDGDYDFYTFHATKGQTFDIQVHARRLRSPLDPVVHVAVKGDKYLTGNDDAVGPDANLRFQAPEDGDYVVYLHDHLNKGGPGFFYRMEVAAVAPATRMTVTTEQTGTGTGAIAAAVPRGNRQALLVTASRQEWGGDLKVNLPDLPPGVTFEADAMAASQPVVPVLLTAAGDASIGARLCTIEGAPGDGNINGGLSSFETTAVLVLGQNNVDFYDRTVGTVPVAVVEEAPFSIEIAEPKVPLVRNGTMNLKVIAKRAEGFTAPIAVALPWVPPGVGAGGGVTIPEGQNEVTIPLNANGNAELREWKIVVDGTANTATGPMTVSTQLARLAVAEPYVGLNVQNAAVEQGLAADLLVEVQKLKEFPGDASVTLIGLPNAATTEVQTLKGDSPNLVFKIQTKPETPEGQHKNLFCQVVFTQDGEPIVHNLGSGTLRVDKPAPKPEAAPAAEAKPEEAKPAEPAPAPEKPLSRLEMLRREAAARAAGKQP